MNRPRHVGGPPSSPWIPVAIIGIIFLIAGGPFSARPDPIAYQAARTASGFQMPVLWIPVVLIIALQWLAASKPGSWWPRQQHRYPPRRMPPTYNRRGGLSSFAPPLDQYANDASWVLPSFMDFGGHWLLILLAIVLFTIVGSSPSYAVRPSFPWSLFSRRAAVVPF